MKSRLIPASLLVGLLACAYHPQPAGAQRDFDNVQIRTIPVADGVFMLMGAGGNMGLSVGDDGAFLIDDQFAPLTEKIQAAVAAQSEQPIRFVVNTHWHGDHTGGNENLGKAGALLVAHENVRKRMRVEQFMEAFNRTVPASPAEALPVITFADSITFHWNDDEIRVFHVDPAHTDGDSIIHFVKANVVHTGDTYFNSAYPFIDLGSGGSLDGVIAAADKVLAMVNDTTKIIPGHGELSNQAELQAYREMLVTVRGRVRRLIDAGKSREEVMAAQPTSDFDAKWGGGFMRPEVWLGIVYASLTDN